MRLRTLEHALAGALFLGVLPMTSALGGTYDLVIDTITVDHGDGPKEAIAYNGHSPGRTLRFEEGEEVTINVTNNLDRSTSIHWHGLILPFEQDGVPGISYPGIDPGETFTYRFPIQQAGTYWFHSHTGLQEQEGAYGSIVIEPTKREPFKYDRDVVIVLADSHAHAPERILGNLKKMADYYNRQQQTVGDFFADVRAMGFAAAWADRRDWGSMRMMKTDIEDVQGYQFLINGRGAEHGWIGLFEPGEKIRLRFVNASAMTYFDVRIPGLKMTVVSADGNNVQPVVVDEFRIAVAETYDVLVEPQADQAYTIFAESMARTGFARATLAPKPDMSADTPEPRRPPMLTMADMGMAHAGMEGMDHGAMAGTDHAGMAGTAGMEGMDHAAMSGSGADPFYAPGSGLLPAAANGGKFLSYADLKAQKPLFEDRPATREIELRLTGNMERYMWSINGIKYEDAEPIRLRYGERVRFKFVNETMMSHPMHLHGMWSIIDNGSGRFDPIKHVISIAPGTTVYTETEVDAPGRWAFHCHLMYHMATGMFREVIVEGGPPRAALEGAAVTDTTALN
ncbi:MAG: copper resistance system multicopper oxidase [Geminicoccaceae bacterium]|nr:copper resistance system multicopper oxidase [Geminicoccaceae bacterium]